jgi:hypothetical protein
LPDCRLSVVLSINPCVPCEASTLVPASCRGLVECYSSLSLSRTTRRFFVLPTAGMGSSSMSDPSTSASSSSTLIIVYEALGVSSSSPSLASFAWSSSDTSDSSSMGACLRFLSLPPVFAGAPKCCVLGRELEKVSIGSSLRATKASSSLSGSSSSSSPLVSCEPKSIPCVPTRILAGVGSGLDSSPSMASEP